MEFENSWLASGWVVFCSFWIWAIWVVFDPGPLVCWNSFVFFGSCGALQPCRKTGVGEEGQEQQQQEQQQRKMSTWQHIKTPDDAGKRRKKEKKKNNFKDQQSRPHVPFIFRNCSLEIFWSGGKNVLNPKIKWSWPRNNCDT